MADPFDTPGYRFAVNNFPGDGSTTDWNIDFAGRTPGYISIDHVRAALIDDTTGEETPVLLGPANFILPTRIRVTPAVPVGVTLRVWRDTPKDLPMLDYTDGALMIERNLDTSNEQTIYAIAEMVDRFADSLDDVREFTEAVLDRLADVEEQAQEAYDTSNTAISTANTALVNSVAAVNTANDALAGVAGAEQAAIEATEAADNANAAAVVATAAANNANQAAQDATDTAALAVSIAQNAEDVANGIDSKAQTALDNSVAAVSTANSAEATANGVDAKAQTALDNSATALQGVDDLANATDPARGAALVGYKGSTVSDILDLSAYVPAALGDGGATDPFPAMKLLIEAAQAAGVARVAIPPGHYKTTYKNPADPANYIHITKPIEICAVPGTVTLENFLVYVHGEYDSLQLVGSAGFTSGDQSINSAAAHGLEAGDYVQLLSSLNAGSTDAGAWQMESVNPTTSAPGSMRFSEIHRVLSVDSATTATLYDSVIYPDYKDNVTGYEFPLPGLVGAQIRRLRMVEGVAFRGINFVNTENAAFRGILIRCAADVNFEQCGFKAAAQSGAHIKATDTLRLTFDGCDTYRENAAGTGSNWNSFLIGGGTSDVLFRACTFNGEAQTIDFTPLIFTSDIGASTGLSTSQITVQNIKIDACTFNKCGDGFTTHPGCYNVIATGNVINGGDTGMRLRSLKNTVTGNSITAKINGINLSAFYDHTLIASNNISAAEGAASFVGVAIVPMSSETMNNNNLQDVSIKANNFTANYGTSRIGVQFRQYGNGVPPAGFAGFTDAIKTSKSSYGVSENLFTNCFLQVNRYISGVRVVDNSFGGAVGGDIANYIQCGSESSAAYLRGNRFLDSLAEAIFIGAPSALPFAYEKRHVVGENYGIGTVTSTIDAGNAVYDTVLTLAGASSVDTGSSVATSGTWTPTVISSSNTSSVAPFVSLYSRVGNVVTVSGQVTVTPAAVALTVVNLSLPFASDFTTVVDGNGGIWSEANGSGLVNASSTVDGLSMRFTPTAAVSTVYKFSASYLIK